MVPECRLFQDSAGKADIFSRVGGFVFNKDAIPRHALLHGRLCEKFRFRYGPFPRKTPHPAGKEQQGSQLPGIKFRRIFRHPYVIAAKNENEFRRMQHLLHVMVVPQNFYGFLWSHRLLCTQEISLCKRRIHHNPYLPHARAAQPSSAFAAACITITAHRFFRQTTSRYAREP